MSILELTKILNLNLNFSQKKRTTVEPRLSELIGTTPSSDKRKFG